MIYYAYKNDVIYYVDGVCVSLSGVEYDSDPKDDPIYNIVEIQEIFCCLIDEFRELFQISDALSGRMMSGTRIITVYYNNTSLRLYPDRFRLTIYGVLKHFSEGGLLNQNSEITVFYHDYTNLKEHLSQLY
jgi:hypothetical protein